MGITIDRRIYPRNTAKSTIYYEHQNTTANYYANMINYGRGGMYFESPFPLKPGTDISIRVDNNFPCLTGVKLPDEYTAEVKWCKEIFDADKFCFGIGVQYWNNAI